MFKRFLLVLICVFALVGISGVPAQVPHDFSKFEEEMGWANPGTNSVDACEMQSVCCIYCLPDRGNVWIQCNFYMDNNMNWRCKCSFEGPC